MCHWLEPAAEATRALGVPAKHPRLRPGLHGSAPTHAGTTQLPTPPTRPHGWHDISGQSSPPALGAWRLLGPPSRMPSPPRKPQEGSLDGGHSKETALVAKHQDSTGFKWHPRPPRLHDKPKSIHATAAPTWTLAYEDHKP